MKFGMIGFENYKIDCIIGVYEEERRVLQTIYVDLKVSLDFTEAAKSDNLEKTICYEELANLCKHLAETKKYRLLETYAYDLITTLTNEYNVNYASVKLKKPAAILSADYAIVELESRPLL